MHTLKKKCIHTYTHIGTVAHPATAHPNLRIRDQAQILSKKKILYAVIRIRDRHKFLQEKKSPLFSVITSVQ